MKGTRTRNLFDPQSEKPFKISRSKLDLFLNCPRCFYLDRKLGLSQPSGPPFSLNSAVDGLLKREFDGYRARGEAHPLMREAGIDAVPFQHADLEVWRDSLHKGITWHDEANNLIITGGVDDVWVGRDGRLIMVDYKATAKKDEVSLDAPWQISYKRQIETYQFLFRKNGFEVDPVGYFVYCNGILDAEAFNGKLDFRIKLIPYHGDDSWIPGAIERLKNCLMTDALPPAPDRCEYCQYRLNSRGLEPD